VLRAKPVAVVGASTGIFGAVWAQAEVRKVLNAIGARALDDEVPVGQADDAFAADGSLSDPRLRELLADAIATLIDVVRALERPRVEQLELVAVPVPNAGGSLPSTTPCEDLDEVSGGAERRGRFRTP